MIDKSKTLPGSVLVAGGAGYIGSHTAKALHGAGFVPVVIDNLSTGSRDAVRFGPFYESSIADSSLLAQAIRRHRPTCAILFAGSAYVGESVKNPRKYLNNNVTDSIRFLDTLLDAGIRRVVFSSSCSVYGVQDEAPIRENSATNPLSPYAGTKLFIENVLEWYDRAYGLRYVSLRYFNAAGADPDGELGERHDPETHLIPLAIGAAMGGPPLSVLGTDYPTVDGTAIRDYTHVTDLAQGHIRALEYLAEASGSITVNLGTGTGYSVQQVIRAVEKQAGRAIRVVHRSRREGDAPVLIADPSRARELLTWVPQYSSLETIVRTAWHWHGYLKQLEPQGHV